MKLNYFHYYLSKKHDRSHIRYEIDFWPIVKEYLKATQRGVVLSHECADGEHFALLDSKKDRCLIAVATRDQDIIKALDSGRTNHTDIKKRLSQGESVACASYVYMGNGFLTYGTTLRGPKAGTFRKFMDAFIEKYISENYQFTLRGAISSVDKSTVKDFARIGMMTMCINPNETIGQEIAGLFSTDPQKVYEFEIRLKPKRGGNLSKTFDAMDKAGSIEQIYKFKLRAKAALNDDMEDFFLTEQGQLADIVDARSETKILQALTHHAATNRRIHEFVNLEKDKNAYKTLEDNLTADLIKRGGWDRFLPSDSQD